MYFNSRSKPAASLTWKVNGVEVNPWYEYMGSEYKGYGYERDNGGGSGGGGSREEDVGTPAGLNTNLQAELREYRPKKADGNLETSALGLTFRGAIQYDVFLA